MKAYVLRDIDPMVWRQVKTKAASKGMTVREVIASLLKAWATSKK